MRNIWCVPTVEILQLWLAEAGFDEIDVVSIARTTPDEQRSTDWMQFESLREALHPANPSRTVEDYPAPVRAIVTGRLR